jgi:hypothetical protein
LGAPAEFERNAAEYEPDQHGDNRRIEGGHQDRVGQRKCGHQAAATQHQPGLVAVPYRCDGIHHHIAVMLLREKWKQHSEPEIKAIHDDVHEHCEGDDKGPQHCDVEGELGHGDHPCP